MNLWVRLNHDQHYEKMSLMLHHINLIYYFLNVIIEAVTRIYILFDYHIDQLVLLLTLLAYMLYLCIYNKFQTQKMNYNYKNYSYNINNTT